MEVNDLEPTIQATKELGQAYSDTAGLISEYADDLKAVDQLYDHGFSGTGNSMIKFGIALIMVPEPFMVSDLIGGGIVAAGLLYNKLSPPPIFVDDIFEAIESQVKALHECGESLTRGYTIPLDFSSIHFDI